MLLNNTSTLSKLLDVYLPIKPFSANKMHYATHKRDTKEYRSFKYEVKMALVHSGFTVKPTDKYKLSLIVGYSSKLSDLDNAFKPTLDAMQLALGFDDRQVFEIAALKNHVKKGDEYMLIRLETITDVQWLRRMKKLFPSWDKILELLPVPKSKTKKKENPDARKHTVKLNPTTW